MDAALRWRDGQTSSGPISLDRQRIPGRGETKRVKERGKTDREGDYKREKGRWIGGRGKHRENTRERL